MRNLSLVGNVPRHFQDAASRWAKKTPLQLGAAFAEMSMMSSRICLHAGMPASSRCIAGLGFKPQDDQIPILSMLLYGQICCQLCRVNGIVAWQTISRFSSIFAWLQFIGHIASGYCTNVCCNCSPGMLIPAQAGIRQSVRHGGWLKRGYAVVSGPSK